MRSLILVFLLVALPVGVAKPCSCGPITLSELYTAADLIFVGRLTSVAISDDNEWQLEGRFSDIEWFKGTPTESVNVTTHIADSMCGVEMLVTRTYLVFASASGKTDLCSTTGVLDGNWGDTPRAEWAEALRTGRIASDNP